MWDSDLKGGQQTPDAASFSSRSLQLVKYGIIDINTLCQDLLDWDTLYVSGRMHKPVCINMCEFVCCGQANVEALASFSLERWPWESQMLACD